MGKNKLRKLKAKSGPRFRPLDKELHIDYNSFKPAFSFRHMNYGHGKCLSRCDHDSKSSISSTLLRLSQLTWSQIFLEPKEGLGCEKIANDRFKEALPPIITPDVTVLVFRFSGAGRMAGFRNNDIYHIVQVCPHHDLY